MKRNKVSKGIMEEQTAVVFVGESLEEKIRRATEGNQPIEGISPMIYTERKDGVMKAYDIRADKWDIAQTAMTSISEGHRTKRQERLKKETSPAQAAADRPTETNQA